MPNTLSQHQSAPADEAQVNREFRRKLLLVMAGFAVAAFVVTELMHYLLVPDLGPYRERVMAEGGSALILAMLAGKLLHSAYKARQRTLARLQVIAELNHHVRNALEVISLSAYITHDEQAIRRITEGVNRIDWALREILPREKFPVVSGEPPTDLDASPPSGSAPRAASDAPAGTISEYTIRSAARSAL
ncbi:MAG: hypothetical protein ACM3PW_02260 [Chlamydiota bacterium]